MDRKKNTSKYFNCAAIEGRAKDGGSKGAEERQGKRRAEKGIEEGMTKELEWGSRYG